MTERKETIEITTIRVIKRGLRLSDIPKVAKKIQKALDNKKEK
jgi:hypothetical protein